MVSVQSKACSSQISPNHSVTVCDQPLFKWDFNVTSWVPGHINVCDNEAAGAITRVANLQVIILLFILNFNFRTPLHQYNLAKWRKTWDHTWGNRLQVLKPVVCPLRSSCHLNSLSGVVVNHLQSPVPAQQSATVFLGNLLLCVPPVMLPLCSTDVSGMLNVCKEIIIVSPDMHYQWNILQ